MARLIASWFGSGFLPGAPGTWGSLAALPLAWVIVIDEVAGQWLTLFALPLDIFAYAIGFALFRLFDIWKPWPIRAVERRCGGGFGIMIDDVLAAIYALVVIVIGRWLLER
jgi:phosphatidylglycerophosphatase A